MKPLEKEDESKYSCYTKTDEKDIKSVDIKKVDTKDIKTTSENSLDEKKHYN